MVRSRDTTPDADAVHLEVIRTTPPERRAAEAYAMSMAARAIALAGIRSRHPDYSDDQARYALFRLLVGDDLYRRAWPRAPVLAP